MTAVKAGGARATHSRWRRGAARGIGAAVARGSATPTTGTIRTDTRFHDRCLGRIPMGGRADPGELAPRSVFLAAAGACYSTGPVFAADGGMTTR